MSSIKKMCGRPNASLVEIQNGAPGNPERIYVIASAQTRDAKNEKGRAFENAMKTLFNAYSLEDVQLRSLGPGGEIDITARHSLTDREVLAECKGHAKKIDARILQQSLGKLRSQEDSDAKDFFLFAAGGVTPQAERDYGEMRKTNPNFYVFGPRTIYEKLIKMRGTQRVSPLESVRQHWMGPGQVVGGWLLCTELGWYWAVSLADEGTNSPRYWCLLTRHGRGAMENEVLRFSDSIQNEIKGLCGREYILAPLSSLISIAPPMRWRGEHFSSLTRPLKEYLNPKRSRYGKPLEKLRQSTDRFLSASDVDVVWRRHRDQVVKYAGELVPDEIKELISDFELACVYAVAQRSAEVQLRKRHEPDGSRLREVAERALSTERHLYCAVEAVIQSLVENRDIVMEPPSIGADVNLDFVLAINRIVTELDLCFSRFPRERYLDICPHHGVSRESLREPQFRVDAIDLDYNRHQIIIRAVCGDSEVHKVIATLADFANQTLNAVGAALDARYISLLKVTLAVTPVGYQGKHYEFRTQVSSVVAMFMGEELYGKQRIFLRELLQNARDAILTRAQICKNQENDEYSPSLIFSLSSGEKTLVCTDNGIGMDQYTIERYLADIGRSFYTSDDYRNLVEGVADERTSPVSRFGIGILSCFMVANKVTMRTRQDNKPGLLIEIPARGAFFYVQEDPTINFVGTEVTLDLKEEAIGLDAKWRQLPKRSTTEIDCGVLVEVDGALIPGNRDRDTKKLLVHRRWKLCRFLSGYAVDLPFSIEVLEDGNRSVIQRHRLSENMREAKTWDGFAAHRGFPISAVVGLSPEEERTHWSGKVRKSTFRVLSCGGIYVEKMDDFNLKSFGMPDWTDYVVDLAPQRARINLERSNIISFMFRENERAELTCSLASDVGAKKVSQFLRQIDRKAYERYIDSVWAAVDRLAKVTRKTRSAIINQNHYVAALRFRSGECEAWFGPIGHLDEAGVFSVMLANLKTRSAEFAKWSANSRRAEPDMIVVYDYKFREAVKLTGMRVDVTKCPEEHKVVPRETDRSDKASIEMACTSLMQAKREFFALAFKRGEAKWRRLGSKRLQEVIKKIEKSASRLTALIGKENVGD